MKRSILVFCGVVVLILLIMAGQKWSVASGLGGLAGFVYFFALIAVLVCGVWVSDKRKNRVRFKR